MRSGQRPAAPNAETIAGTQARYNTQAAQQTQQMGMMNQTGPSGSLTYNRTGSFADGSPQYTATTAFNAPTQALYDTNMGTAQTLASRIQQNASNPFTLDNNATESRLMELGRKRLDPLLAQQRTARESDLLNRGLTMGSEAYNNALTQVGQQENDAYNQLLLTGRQQAVSELLTERNQPIQELQQVLGAVPNAPQFGSTPSAQVAAPDYQGAASQQYQAELNDYNQQQQQQQAMYGGLFGLGGTLLGGASRAVPSMFGGWGR